uniref:YncE family protein n=1 Tax=Phenylobacterium glaciei TaxID=2803784 RepID=A0A974P1D6_9CAUL|nr:hypothetical protein JKL49_20900 [Phenylobacterium glaciei]
MDATTGALLATVATGNGPDDAIIEPKTGLLLVMDHKGGTVTLVHAKTHTVAGTIAVGGILEAAAVDGKGRVFVNVEDKNQIAVLDIPGRKVTARYELAGCEGPTGIAYAAADKLLISSCDGVAEIVAAETGKVVRQIKIGDGADGVAYDAGRHLAFIPAGMAGTLSVISVSHGDATLIDTVMTQKGARTLALDTARGRVFLPVAKYVIPTDGGRPTPTPAPSSCSSSENEAYAPHEPRGALPAFRLPDLYASAPAPRRLPGGCGRPEPDAARQRPVDGR